MVKVLEKVRGKHALVRWFALFRGKGASSYSRGRVFAYLRETAESRSGLDEISRMRQA